MDKKNKETNEKLFTLSEARKELDIPLILAKKLVVWGEMEAQKALDGTIRITESELNLAKRMLSNPKKRAAYFVKALGPGLITGASDDDPSGIGTYSSVGAKFGFTILWMAAWLLPMMLAVQEACARIGIITNRGLAGVLQKHYRKNVVFAIVLLLIVANIINIGADLGAMSASLSMLTGFNFYLGAVLFAVTILFVEIFLGYHIYAKFLKWLTASVMAYIIAGIIVHPDWIVVLKNSFIPSIKWSEEYIFAIIAVFGTTITPYLFFWQASEEVEENKPGYKLFFKDPKKMHYRILRMRTDVKTGMILANVVFFFIVVTTASTLFGNGITEIDSPEQAALALKPLAGNWAYLLFSLGIIGTGLLAVPILAGSGAYAISEIMKWKEGLELKYSQAKGFYAVIILSVLLGLSLNFFGINPMKTLYYSAYLNGIVALPLLIAIMIVGNDKKIMGEETHPLWVKIFGWMSVFFMVAAIALSLILLF